MKKPSTHHHFGIAACSLAITASGEVQLTPAGRFVGRDGRPMDAPGWFMDATLAAKLIAAADTRATPYVIDYDHQTLLAKENGKPAPAAGFFKKLEWREGVGLFAIDVEWTENAKDYIASGEFKFISPVIGYDKATGNVIALYMAAITNNPSIDGMNEVLLSTAALHFQFTPTPLTSMETVMDDLLENLRWMLNLPVGSTADEIKAQLQKLIEQIKTDPVATAAASFDLAAHLQAQGAQVVALNAQIAQGASAPDPAKFVAVGVMQALQTQVAQLSAELTTKNVNDVVVAALNANKLLPSQEAWARAWGAKDLSALQSYITSAPSIAALTSMQTTTVPPGMQTTSLTENQAALCAAMGVKPEDFLKTLQAETQV